MASHQKILAAEYLSADGLLESWALRHFAMPAPYIGKRRQIDIEREATVNHGSQGNISNCKIFAGNPRKPINAAL
jgi:hypothetical protein